MVTSEEYEFGHVGIYPLGVCIHQDQKHLDYEGASIVLMDS